MLTLEISIFVWWNGVMRRLSVESELLTTLAAEEANIKTSLDQDQL